MAGSRKPGVLRALLLVAGLQAVVLLVYYGIETARRRAAAPPFGFERVNGPRLPEAELVRPDGTAFGALAGRTVLLHFWATWCPPCREELPDLLTLPERIGGDRPLEVVALTLDPDWARVREFFGGSIPAAVVRDPGDRLATAWGVSALPDTYLVGPDGGAILRFAGARDWRAPSARDLLRAQLASLPDRAAAEAPGTVEAPADTERAGRVPAD